MLTAAGKKMVLENFTKPKEWEFLQESMNASTPKRVASGSWLITPGIESLEHVFIFFQQSDKVDSFSANPYAFDTFDLDGDNSAKLASCRLQYARGPILS